MRKIILFICFFSFINLNISYSDYQLNSDEIKKINNVSKKIEILINQNGLEYKQNILDLLLKYLNKSTNGTKNYEFFNLLVKNVQNINLENIYLEHYKTYNINFEEIEDYWINLHNDVRKQLGLSLYSYDYRLNNTAYERSTIQNGKAIMEHKRNPGDSYYDYNVIENWFQDRGVHCKVINHLTTSESIGKFGYYCNDGECSEELKKSIKVIFDIYMDEKDLPYSENAHYRAITHTSITKMGVGISIRQTEEKNYYEYYITTHYCSEFID